MYCPYCGTKIDDDSKFCGNCGHEIKLAETTASALPEEEPRNFDSLSQLRETTPPPSLDDFPPEPKRKVWPYIVIGAAAAVIVAAVCVFFFVIRPNMNSSHTAEIPPVVEEKESETEEPTTIAKQEETTTEPETTTQETTAAAKEFPREVYTTAESGLLLRDGPGKNYTAVYLIGYGTKITIEKEENGWAYTTVAGLSGWVSTEFLTENENELKEYPTIASANPKELVQPPNKVDYGYHGTTTAEGGLLMRYGPGTEYEAIDVLPYGTAIVEEGYYNEWIYIQYKGRYGWINSNYVEASGGMAKPAIYLYPTEKLEVSVDIKLSEGSFQRTAPVYSNGWRVTAYPDGTLVDPRDGKPYDYIYWESDSEPAYDWTEGYVVRGSETKEFLLDVLPKMGLIPKEYNEFIDYWLPRMQKNDYNLVTFQNECYTDAAQMEISPAPDSCLRIFMAYRAIERPIEITPPEIQPFERNGFTVVEWGGAEVK